MPVSTGVSFLYNYDIGNRNISNPGVNVLRVTSTANGDFGKENLNTESTSHRWRSTSAAITQEIVLRADFIAEIDTFAILGHNLTTSAVVRVQANFGDEWTAPPFNRVVPVTELQKNLIVTTEGFGAAYEFYRVTILDPSNTAGYIEIGRIVGGRALIFTNNEDITDQYTVGHTDESERMQTQGYFRHSNENVIVRKPSIKFSKLESVTGRNDNYLGLVRFYNYVKTTRPFLFILNRNDPSVLNVHGQLTGLPTESYDVNRYVNMTFNIEEVF